MWGGNYGITTRRVYFSVKSAYKLYMNLKTITDTNSSTIISKFWPNIWNLNISLKIRTFLWRSAHNFIPATLNLSRRDLDVSPFCPCCRFQVESTTHALCLSSSSANLVHGSSLCPSTSALKCLIPWPLWHWQTILSNSKIEIAAITCWVIWNGINHINNQRPILNV